jgi:hypothetical protein
MFPTPLLSESSSCPHRAPVLTAHAARHLPAGYETEPSASILVVVRRRAETLADSVAHN